MSTRNIRYFAFVLLLNVVGCADSACPLSANIGSSTHPSLDIRSERLVRSSNDPFRLGLNLEWVGFQTSFWDSKRGGVRTDVLPYLRDLPGVVYRYPGGTVANHFSWKDSDGRLRDRREQRPVDWRGPLVAHFGPSEYRRFLQEVDGVPWVVLNLWGYIDRSETQGYLSAEARKAAVAFAGSDVLRWELGNELDRSPYLLTPEAYGRLARAIVGAMAAEDGEARFVGMMQDYEVHPRYSAADYNRAVATELPAHVDEFAQHMYFDGKPGGPPIPHRVKHMCATLEAAAKGGKSNAALWVTEFGRWPPGKVSDPDWKLQWPKSSNLGAAIGVVDFILAVTQIPQIKGTFLHSLSGTKGPWQLIHEDPNTGKLFPSAVYSALRLVHPFLSWNVLESRTASPNESGYSGGYDVRAAAFSNPKRSGNLSVIAINRGGIPAWILACRDLPRGK